MTFTCQVKTNVDTFWAPLGKFGLLFTSISGHTGRHPLMTVVLTFTGVQSQNWKANEQHFSGHFSVVNNSIYVLRFTS